MKDSLKNFLVTGLLFGTLVGAFTILTTDLVTGFIAGAIMGTLFGAAIGTFTFFMGRKYRGKGTEVTGNPNIIMDGPSNHVVRKESVGGWMYLTDKDLYFKSHMININTHIFILPLDQIANVRKYKIFGLVPTGLIIQTTEGKDEKFIAYDIKKWICKINEGIVSLKK